MSNSEKNTWKIILINITIFDFLQLLAALALTFDFQHVLLSTLPGNISALMRLTQLPELGAQVR